MEKLLRWFGVVPAARLIRMEDKHNDEMLRMASEHAIEITAEARRRRELVRERENSTAGLNRQLHALAKVSL